MANANIVKPEGLAINLELNEEEAIGLVGLLGRAMMPNYPMGDIYSALSMALRRAGISDKDWREAYLAADVSDARTGMRRRA